MSHFVQFLYSYLPKIGPIANKPVMGETMTSVATSDGELSPLGPTSPPAEHRRGEAEAPLEQQCFESPLGDPEGMHCPSGPGSLEDDSFAVEQVSIVDGDGLRAMGEMASSRGYLWIALDPPGPQHRGRLGLYLEEAIESELEERGALPPGIQASTGLDASLSDQLYRARLVEMHGIALGIPSLEGITNLGRSLDAEDSAVLRWWIAATESRPVRLVISRENTKLRVYPSPVLFETLFEVAPSPVTPLPPSPQMAESSQSMDLSDLPPSVRETNVLGTKVAPLESGTEAESEDDFEQDYEDYGRDVDLPDLDRALGLIDDVDDQAPARAELRAESADLGKSGQHSAAQLALHYDVPVSSATDERWPPQMKSHDLARAEETSPARLTQIASPPPPAQEPVSESTLRSEGAVASENAVGSEAVVVSAGAAGEEDLREEEGQQASPVEMQSAEPSFDDLDAEEFLRTLKEDSERAPEVAEAEPEVPAEPAPLPTKKIARNPFIRLADPALAVDDGSEPGDIVLDGKTLVDVPIEDKHAKTLSGPAAPDPNDPFNQLAVREWKTWVKNLEAARGPKPLSVIERMFVTDYTRLREAVRRGVAEKSAEGILDEWRESFSKSYSEAFDALRVRGKRPSMVLDLPELAARLGRLQGAKRVQLLLVDGLRFDLGLMVQDRMRELADAALTERLLLWSALPSTTSYQLELLGKGPDGLKSTGEVDEPPALVARGAGARVPRRVRTGSLELLKLDVVEDSLRKVGPPIQERMDAIAAATATAITEHLSKQPPRTMVVAFGDHGFALDPAKAGTTEEVLQGGSSPEEILVPAFAWLTGAVH